MDVLRVGLGAGLLQVRNRINFPKNTVPDNTILISIPFMSKSLSRTKTCYSNIERETLGILHGLQEILPLLLYQIGNVITDHEPSIFIFRKDVATPFQRLKDILQGFHPYKLYKMYKVGPNLYIADWLQDRRIQRTKVKK